MYNLCVAQNLNVDKSSIFLLKEFCKCPEAAQLLDSTASSYKKLHFETGEFPSSRSGIGRFHQLANIDKLSLEMLSKIFKRQIMKRDQEMAALLKKK